MIRVLYIIGGSGKRYGSEIVSMELMHNLKNRYGVDFTVITANDGVVNDYCRAEKIENYVIPFRDYVYKKIDFGAVNFLKWAIRMLQAEIADKIAIEKIKKKIVIKKIDIIQTNISRNLLGLKISKKYSIPHLWHLQEMTNEGYHLSFLKKNQIQLMNANTDLFVAISKIVKESWIQKGISIKKVNIIWNGIDTSRYKPIPYESKKIDNEDKKIHVLMIGYMSEVKGQMELLKAFSEMNSEQLSQFVVDFYGSGDEKYIKKMKLYIKDHNLNNYINFKGYEENLENIIKKYDVGINCSRSEAFGLVTVEYMASGVCPIVSNTGSNPDIVVNGQNGLIYEYGNVDSLKNCLLYVRDNREILNKYGHNARQCAVEKFELTRMIDEFYEAYKILKER